jgi:hypothetical protein
MSVQAPLEVPPEAVPVPLVGVRGVLPVGLQLPVPVLVRGVLPLGLQLPVAVGAIDVWGHRAVAVLPVGVAVLPARASFVSVPE